MIVVWSTEAIEEADAIRAVIALVSQRASWAWRIRLDVSVSMLERFPRAGRIVPEYAEESLRELVVGRARVWYRLRADHVEVVRVWDSRRMAPDRVEERGAMYGFHERPISAELRERISRLRATVDRFRLETIERLRAVGLDVATDD